MIFFRNLPSGDSASNEEQATSNLANFAAASDSDSAGLDRVVETTGFGTGTSLLGGGADCSRDLCLNPLAVEVGVSEATALMVVVGPSTTATIDGTPRCAIPCEASHDVEPPGLDDSQPVRTQMA